MKIYWLLVGLIGGLILFSPYVQAYDVTYIIDDYNTLQPIEGAAITLTNASTSINALSDDHGEYVFTFAEAQNFSVTVTHSGYSPYASSLNVTNATVKNVYLEPSSHEGIIRLSVIDLTLTEHKSLIYFDNGRLMGVYEPNETITLHTNMNYTWVPALDKTDILLNKKGLLKYSWNYLGIGIGAILFFSALALFIGFLWRIIKK